VHHLAAADRPAQHRLVDHCPQQEAIGALQQLLPLEPQHHPAFDVLGPVIQEFAGDQRADVVLGLQQAGDDLALVAANPARGRFQVDVGPEPWWQEIAVVRPPARLAGLPGEGHQHRDPVGVGDTVQGKQVDDIAVLEADLAVLQPVDLPLRGPDRLAGLLAGEARLGPQAAQLRADQHPSDGRAAPWFRLNVGHIYPPQPDWQIVCHVRPDRHGFALGDRLSHPRLARPDHSTRDRHTRHTRHHKLCPGR
jgi:hypothetical protein